MCVCLLRVGPVDAPLGGIYAATALLLTWSQSRLDTATPDECVCASAGTGPHMSPLSAYHINPREHTHIAYTAALGASAGPFR